MIMQDQAEALFHELSSNDRATARAVATSLWNDLQRSEADPATLDQLLSLVHWSLRPDTCLHFGPADRAVKVMDALKNTCPSAPSLIRLQGHCFKAWLGEWCRQASDDLIALFQRYPTLDSSSQDECRLACRQFGEVVNKEGGLYGMMTFHDAAIVAIGSWTPDLLDFNWGGIGEWQSRRGWHFSPGSLAAGEYVFAQPARWPCGYLPTHSFDCMEPGPQHLILRLCTTPTNRERHVALAGLDCGDNPFIVAACAWVVGQSRMAEASARLKSLLKHDSWVVRAYAAEALWRINGNRDEVLPVLLEMIAREATLKENWKTQLRAVRLIEEMGDLDSATSEAITAHSNRLQAMKCQYREHEAAELSSLDFLFRA